MGVLSLLVLFYVSVGVLDDIFPVFLPLLFGYFYVFWVVPLRQILLQGLEEVCIHIFYHNLCPPAELLFSV